MTEHVPSYTIEDERSGRAMTIRQALDIAQLASPMPWAAAHALRTLRQALEQATTTLSEIRDAAGAERTYPFADLPQVVAALRRAGVAIPAVLAHTRCTCTQCGPDLFCAKCSGALFDLPQATPETVHPDDAAADQFSAMLKSKLASARRKGRNGWRDPSWTAAEINRQLHAHAEKGDPLDVAAYAMFLALRGEKTTGRLLLPHIAAQPEGNTVTQQPEKPTLEWSPTSEKRMTHLEAEQWCRDLRHNGNSDWRLPAINELQRLVDYTKYNPAADAERFPDTKSAAYWTASPDASDPDYAWIVNFGYGYVLVSHRLNAAWVRAVRESRASQ